MKGLSAYEAKKVVVRAPVSKIVTLYTINGTKLTFAEVYALVHAINPDVGESKIRSRLSSGHRVVAMLAADQLPRKK